MSVQKCTDCGSLLLDEQEQIDELCSTCVFRFEMSHPSNAPDTNDTTTVEDLLTKLHKAHYDDIDGVDNCEVAIAEATAQINVLIAKARIDERSVYIKDHISGRNSAFIARVKNAVEHEHIFNQDSASCACGVSKMFLVEAADEISELLKEVEQ